MACRYEGREQVEVAVDRGVDETAECRRLAELLNLDAVGIMRVEGDVQRVSWWAAPGSGPVPLHIQDAIYGRADGWIASPRGSDVVFARLTPRSSVRSVAALRGMLASLTRDEHAISEQLPEHEDAQSRERSRWAYAIHDGLTQVVTAAVLELEWMARKVDVEPSEAVAVLTEASVELRRALEEIRLMLTALSPQGTGEEEPLEELIQQVLARWRLPASWSIDGDVGAMPRTVREAASSVIREGVANAAKHSASKDVEVRVHATPEGMEVRVEDGGRGFKPGGTEVRKGHLGLDMLRRRVAEVRGTLDIESSPGRGTRVVARLPVEERGDEQ
jgi:signal transduction histidine kinase